MRKYSKDWTSKMKDKHGRYIGMFTYGEGSDFAFRRTYDNYRPDMKWGHTHNHIFNKVNKHLFRSKINRRIDRRRKPEFVKTFMCNIWLGRIDFDSLLHIIFHHNKKATPNKKEHNNG